MLAALYAALGWLVRSVLVKFVLFFGLWFVTSELLPVLVSHLPSTAGIESSWAGIPSGVGYFLNVFQIPTGLSMMLSALATRFAIRRIPLLG